MFTAPSGKWRPAEAGIRASHCKLLFIVLTHPRNPCVNFPETGLMVSTEDLIAQPQGSWSSPSHVPRGLWGVDLLALQPPSMPLLGSLSSSLSRGHAGPCHCLWTHQPQLSLGKARAGCKGGRGASQGWSSYSQQHSESRKSIHSRKRELSWLLRLPCLFLFGVSIALLTPPSVSP